MSVLNLSECKNFIDFRIDSNTYKKEYLETEKIITSYNYSTIGDISISVQNFGAYSLCSFINFQDDGIPFLMTENIRDNYIDWNVQKFVDLNSHKMLYKSHCKNGQVLITMAGEYLGRVAVYDKEFVCSSNQAIAKITLKNSFNPYLISTFLNTKYGKNQINRLKTITGQPNINMSLIKDIKILNFNNDFSIKIENIVKQSLKNKDFSQKIYQQAETLLLENLGLQNFQATHQSVNIKALKDSFLQTGRLDAEFYQIKYEQYWNLIQSQDYVFIRDEYLHITQKPDWIKSIYQYIEIGDVNISDGSYQTNWVETQDLPANAKIQVKQGDILISTVRPYRGAVTIIDENDQDLVVSGAFTVLRKKNNSIFNNEVLKVLLRSDLYKDWLLQFNVGTSYPVIKDEDILNLPIPKIDAKIQTQIANYICQSNNLREQATQLLAQAKSKVELEIENNSFNINELEFEGGGA